MKNEHGIWADWHISIRIQTDLTAKSRDILNGMVIARFTGDCFCTNEESWAWLTKGGERNALDDICNPVGAVVTRRRQ
jgi:hypothetical protein